MKVVIMGCGRVGGRLATILDAQGHRVSIIDLDPFSFQRFLPKEFGGQAITGNGLEQDTLRQAGIEEADAFVAVTHGDNRNLMAAQIAKHVFGVRKVVSRVLDPIREEMYSSLGLETMSPTKAGTELILEALEA